MAHNGVMYDLPVLARLLGRDMSELPFCIDTVLVSRLLYSDKQFHPCKNHKYPHSLEAWGEFLGLKKMASPDSWDQCTEYMIDYCQGDVDVTEKLYNYLLPKAVAYKDAIKLEHDAAYIVGRQVRHGWRFDVDAAMELTGKLEIRKAEVEDELQTAFPPTIQTMKKPRYWEFRHPHGGVVTDPSKTKLVQVAAATFGMTQKEARLHVTEGPKMTKEIPFNPGSRAQFAQRMTEKYGWQPQVFTDGGSPQIDESVLEQMGFPEAELMAEYLLLQKRLGQVRDQWLEMEREGRIHGSVITNGTNTGRFTHSKPNVSQVVGVGKEYGKECRALFIPDEGHVLLGCDASGLELRMLAHELYPYDGGEYVVQVTEKDPHSFNQEMAGLATRGEAKGFIYTKNYGGGDWLLGTRMGDLDEDQVQDTLATNPELREEFKKILPRTKAFKSGNRKVTPKDIAFAICGRNARETFNERMPAGVTMENELKRAAKDRGDAVILADNRRVKLRSDYQILNTTLQGNGAVFMKLALVILDNALQKWYTPGEDYEFVGNIHDEWQITCRPEIAQTIGEAAVGAMKRAGEMLKFNCPLTGEFRVGSSWAETH